MADVLSQLDVDALCLAHCFRHRNGTGGQPLEQRLHARRHFVRGRQQRP